MNESERIKHVPVLLQEVLSFYTKKEGKCSMLDCTLGGGGHSEALLKYDEDLSIIGFDRDALAIERVKNRLGKYDERIELRKGDFTEAANLDMEFDFILADFGLSSDQLDDEVRGFSFSSDMPLDMRMDKTQSLTASEVVNEYSPSDLRQVFKRGGVPQVAEFLTKKIISNRPISTTKQLVDIVRPVMKRAKPNSSSSTQSAVVFQAIRIEVNKELEQIKTLLDVVPELLAPGGRFAAISFHSLEDTIVTRCMRSWERGVEVPTNLPIKEVPKGLGSVLTKQAVVPTEKEIEENPRARSARMRVFEKGNG